VLEVQGKHHTGLSDKLQENSNRENHNAMLNGYSPSSEEKSLPAIVQLKIKGKTLWALREEPATISRKLDHRPLITMIIYFHSNQSYIL
jgi:hypothetical protein